MKVLHADKGKRIVLPSPAKPNSAWVPILVTEKGIRLIAYEPPGTPAPAKPQRELRTSTRHRSNQVERRGQLVNEIHKLLEQTNIKLGCVATDIMGVSGRAMLEALLGEQNDAKLLADLAKGRLRNRRAELEKALPGKVQAHHRLVLAQLLTDIDLLDERIAELDREIAQRVAPDQEQIELLDGIPGINQRVAEVIVAEVGTDMSRFPSAKHLASWAGLCPGNNQSGGRRRSGKTREGNRYLRTTLVESAAQAHRKPVLSSNSRAVSKSRLSQQHPAIPAMNPSNRAPPCFGHFWVRKTGDFGLVAVAALRQAQLVNGTRNGHLISLAQGIGPGQVVRPLVERSLPVYDIAPAQETIEDFYLSLMNGRRGLE